MSLLNNMPAVSVIIATYNADLTLTRCLNSIFNQKPVSLEVIVIDGASSDNTVEIINDNSEKITYWHSRKDNGIYDAWNQALTKCKGEYICFIGADDYFADDCALSRIFARAGNNKYDIISSQGKFLKANDGHHIIGAPWNHHKLGKRITVCHPGLLHHRSLFERFGIFNTEFRIVGDYEFLLRLPPETSSLHVDEITVHIADGGISRLRYSEMLKEKRLVQERCLRVGKLKATYNYYEKLCKIPIARLLGLSY